MKEINYIINKIISKINADGTLSESDKMLIEQKCLEAKREIEQEMQQHKILVCTECSESLCLKKHEHVLHCISKGIN